MTGVTATGTGGTSTTTGMFNTFSTTTINNLTTTASGGGGVNNLGMQNVNTSTTTIRNSVITGASFSIIQNATGTVRMTGSTLQPGTVSAAGTFVGEFNVDGSGGPIIC
jgi:tryptophan synthase beta subunit